MTQSEKAQRARRRAAQLLVRARWARTTPEERVETMRHVAAQRTPEQMGAAQRSPDKPRCPCGAMTLKRAQTRRHKCIPPAPAGWTPRAAAERLAQRPPSAQKIAAQRRTKA